MLKQVLILFLILTSGILTAQTFEASTDARQLVLGNQLELTFTLNNARGTNLRVPDFKDFTVVSGPNKSSSMTIVNGRQSSSESFIYTLQPKKIGTLKIGSASIKANGKTLKTNPLSVSVVKGKKSNATTQAEIDKEMSEQVFVEIIPSVTDARIGQQVVLDYKLYTTLGIENYNMVSESEYPGFYTSDMRQFRAGVVKEVRKGVQYTTKIIKRIALFPQQAGLLTIEPAQLQLGISLEDPNNRKRRGFFYTPKVRMHSVTTNEVKISVQKLPENAPESFTGAVGKYKITPLIEKRNLTTDDALTIRLAINGNGDVKQVQAPPLLLPEDKFEVYEPRIIEEENIESRGQLTARKIVEYLVLPKVPGRYNIAPEFTYFDTDSLKYVTLAPINYPVTIEKGTNKKTGAIPQASTDLANQDIRYIKQDTSFSSGKGIFYGSPFFWILWCLPLVALGGIFVYKQKLTREGNVDLITLKRNRAQALARKRLSSAEGYLTKKESRPFYDQVSQGMLGYICDKLNIPTSQLTKDNVKEKMVALHVSQNNIDTYMDIIKTSEMALYAGMDNEADMQKTYNNALEVVTNIEEEIGKE